MKRVLTTTGAGQGAKPVGAAVQQRIARVAARLGLGRKGFTREFRVSTAASAKVPFNLADIGEGIAEVMQQQHPEKNIHVAERRWVFVCRWRCCSGM